jgi:hypothetical protein
MKITIHPHALQRMKERGALEHEIHDTVNHGERFPAKLGRSGFRKNFSFNGMLLNKKYSMKQIEVFAVHENDGWTVITVIVKYY